MKVIAGNARGRSLKAPRGLRTRPTSARARESIFSRLAVRIDIEGLRVLDIFAGSGSLGIESLSRGASRATFIDSSREAVASIRANLETLGLGDRARIVNAEVRRALADLGRAGESFDLIFIDAPFKDDISAAVLSLIATHGLAELGAVVVVEQSKRAPVLPDAPAPLELINLATLGDHRISLFRRSNDAPNPQ